jgi:hypothetical protein
MKDPCHNLITSSDTSKEMGTQFVIMSIQVPIIFSKLSQKLEFHLSAVWKSKYGTSMFLTIHLAPKAAATLPKTAWAIKIEIIALYVILMTVDVL